jgi:hypothetical protein
VQMIIINLYEIIINLLAFATALVLIPLGLLLWFFIGTFIYNFIWDYYRS